MATPSTSSQDMLETFQYELTVEQRNLRDVVRVVLHSICFHRVFGTVRPKTIDLFGMVFPAVQEAEIDRMVEDHTAAFCHQIESKYSNRAELHLFLLHPSASSQRQPASSSSTTTTTTAAAQTDEAPRTPASPASMASKSLKSWASSRTMSGYPYTWLAQAFSGGAGQVGGSHVPQNEPAEGRGAESTATAREKEVADKERLNLEQQSFETWRIRFEVVPTRSERERVRLQSATATGMANFLDSMLQWVDTRKAHIPAIISADLCPFAIEIQGVVVQ